MIEGGCGDLSVSFVDPNTNITIPVVIGIARFEWAEEICDEAVNRQGKKCYGVCFLYPQEDQARGSHTRTFLQTEEGRAYYEEILASVISWVRDVMQLNCVGMGDRMDIRPLARMTVSQENRNAGILCALQKTILFWIDTEDELMEPVLAQ